MMVKTQIVLWIDDDLKRLLKIKFDNVSKKFSDIMKIQLDMEEKNYDDTHIEEIQTQIALLKNKLQDISTEKEQKNFSNYDAKIKQEKINMPVLEKEFMDLLNKWEEETKHKFNIEWRNYLKDNNLMINDCNRVQYWFRFYRSEGKIYQ